MKKKRAVYGAILAAVVLLCATVFSACGLFGKESDENKEYTIQYIDAEGAHSFTIKSGQTFSFTKLPTKDGYTLLGWFDAETGGTQYVSASGVCLAPFEANKNLVLYPQFKPNEYTVVLDYREGTVSGDRQVTAAYDASLPALPTYVMAEHKVFVGWFTQVDCGGVKVADGNGLIPVVSVVNGDNFDLSGNTFTLYAGFEIEKLMVTCHYTAGTQSERLFVPYGTPLSQIAPTTRIDGKGVLTWSKTEGGEKWSGTITEDVDLYATEYAPVIELDLDGGTGAVPIIAKAGATVTLPTPVKAKAQFVRWETQNGQPYTSTVMPDESITIKAIWQPKIQFDSNGGSAVEDIAVAVGQAITLPAPTRSGYIFAGWYTESKTQFTSSTMPNEGVALKAGWYKVKTVKKHFLEGENTSSTIWDKAPWLRPAYDIDFTELASEVDWTKTLNVNITFHADICHFTEDSKNLPLYYTKEHFYFYSQEVVSEAYLVKHIVVDHGNGSMNGNYVTTTFSTQMTVTGGKVFAALASDQTKETRDVGVYWNRHDKGCGWKMKNFWADIEYPDTSNLIL